MKKKVLERDLVYDIAKEQVNALRKAIAHSPDTSSDELIHELRVCIKKLRALLQLYRPISKRVDIQSLDQCVKEIAHNYSNQRDAVVQYDLLCQIIKQIGSHKKQLMQPLHDYFLTLIQENKEQSISANVDVKFDYVLKVWKEKLNPDITLKLNQGLDLSYRKSLKLAHRAVKSDHIETYHQCRKWVKYYLYQLKLLASNQSEKKANFLKKLEDLGGLLGEFHDYNVLEQHLNSLLDKEQRSRANPANTPNMKVAIKLVLACLSKQKTLTKTQSQALFSKVFVHKHSPM
jgi:CHAD domain-containing protein